MAIYLGVEFLCNMITLCLTFWRTIKLFSKMSASFYNPTSNVLRFRFLYILPTLVIVISSNRFLLLFSRGIMSTLNLSDLCNENILDFASFFLIYWNDHDILHTLFYYSMLYIHIYICIYIHIYIHTLIFPC